MQRSILAYDAGWSSCSNVAAQVAGDHRLEVKGLHDPEVRRLLNGARPEWRFQPTLICVEGERVEVFTGPSMAARLVVLVGPRKAGKLVKALGQEASPDGATRRTLLARGFMATGAVLVGSGTAAVPAGAKSSVESTWSMPRWWGESSGSRRSSGPAGIWGRCNGSPTRRAARTSMSWSTSSLTPFRRLTST